MISHIKLITSKGFFHSISGLFIILIILLISNNTFARDQENYEGPIIDLHAHIVTPEDEKENNLTYRLHYQFFRNQINEKSSISTIDQLQDIALKALNKAMKENNIYKIGVMSISESSTLPTEEVSMRNDRIIDLSKQNSHIIPVGTIQVNNKLSNTFKELERLKKLGVKIIKIHPEMHQFDVADKNVNEIAKKLGELNMILMIHSISFYDMNMAGKLFRLAANNPKTKFIFAHTGGIRFMDYISLSTQRHVGVGDNIWLELSYLLLEVRDSPFMEQLKWFVKHIGTDRILFASDYPGSIELSKETIYSLDLSLNDQEKIFYKNALELLE